MFLRAPMIRVVALLLVICSQGVSTKAQERGYLDATQTKIRQRQREPRTGTSGGVITGYTEGKTQPEPSLALSLKIPGRAEIARGEVFEYQVQIRNVSSHPVEIPWDLSSADIEPADPNASYTYQTAAIYVYAKLGENRAVSIEGPILLFGSLFIPPTMIKLQPGEWVRIKAKARALPSNPNDAWPLPGLISKQVEGTLKATLILCASSFSPVRGGNSHEASRIINGPISSNAITITVTK